MSPGGDAFMTKKHSNSMKIKYFCSALVIVLTQTADTSGIRWPGSREDRVGRLFMNLS
jgi:hypothetical protein